MQINLEHTDTFAGESNYSWVRRHTMQIPDDASDRTIVRIAKQWAGITGVRSHVDRYGEMLAIRPSGIAHIIFVTFGE